MSNLPSYPRNPTPEDWQTICALVQDLGPQAVMSLVYQATSDPQFISNSGRTTPSVPSLCTSSSSDPRASVCTFDSVRSSLSYGTASSNWSVQSGTTQAPRSVARACAYNRVAASPVTQRGSPAPTELSQVNPRSATSKTPSEAGHESLNKLFFCTHRECDTGFGKKSDWKKHENKFHNPSSIVHCPHDDCFVAFKDLDEFRLHDSSHHPGRPCYLPQPLVLNLEKKRYWGCGFCKKLLASEKARFNHIGDEHYTESRLKKHQWDYSLEIRNLLAQDLVAPQWRKLLELYHGPKEHKNWPKLRWDPKRTAPFKERLETSSFAPDIGTFLRQLYEFAEPLPMSTDKFIPDADAGVMTPASFANSESSFYFDEPMLHSPRGLNSTQPPTPSEHADHPLFPQPVLLSHPMMSDPSSPVLSQVHEAPEELDSPHMYNPSRDPFPLQAHPFNQSLAMSLSAPPAGSHPGFSAKSLEPHLHHSMRHGFHPTSASSPTSMSVQTTPQPQHPTLSKLRRISSLSLRRSHSHGSAHHPQPPAQALQHMQQMMTPTSAMQPRVFGGFDTPMEGTQPLSQAQTASHRTSLMSLDEVPLTGA
ncbi:hypothetical protein P152DRAFT_481240 [Eremomyces bilateralis CBS 781.70]|uniref:C2H2-type domain-containing protein n=1 Tax=Eremomyces bilateralis CBS 781.70 TaxID=1392243 RepID=A0A6G1G8A0_9PEZI|nr:uncharacterized protein P152DRAFT_481240 [Eremomyces bilateralis CBS 781.70]KAF1814089.1 hypothetical protein P152DRAFT_481240 [Eremomyces bilateralis CBS 781.70]